MKRFILVITDKGGTGKSVFARLLADRYRRDDMKALLVDADGEVGQLFQHYAVLGADGEPVVQQPGEGVLTVGFNAGERQRDRLLEMLDHDADLVLVDMPAGSLSELAELDRVSGFFDELGRAGYRPTFVNVLSPFRASTRTVRQMIVFGGDRADYVAVVNRWFGDAEDFYLWFGDGAEVAQSSGRALLQEQGGIEIELPHLQAGVMVAVDEMMAPFTAAAAEGAPLRRAQRSRLIRWLQEADRQLDRAAPLLGLEKAA